MVVPPTAAEPIKLLRTMLRKSRSEAVAQGRYLAASDPRLTTVLASAKCIGLYLPAGGEPDPALVVAPLMATLALPRVIDRSQAMTFRLWSKETMLEATAWGGWQPIDEAREIVPDVIFVPLLGFDDHLNRLGQGGGFYDRYLAAHPHCCRIGIAWEAQKVEVLDVQPWDVSMDALITERSVRIKDLNRCRHL